MSLYEPVPLPQRDFGLFRNLFSFDNFSAWRRNAKRLLAARGSVEAAWQDNPRRWELAQAVSSVVKESLGLETDHFLPDDSFYGLLMLARDPLACPIDLIIPLEYKLGVEFPDPDDDSLLWRSDLTYGEFLDFILTLPADWGELPAKGQGTPEAQTCSTAWVFWELRRYFRTRLNENPKAFAPEAALDGLKTKVARGLSECIQRRFGVRAPFKRKVLGVLPFGWSSLVLWLFTLAALVWGIGWGWTLFLSVPVYIVGVLLLIHVSPGCWPDGVRTLSDLVNWILISRKERGENARMIFGHSPTF